MRCKCVDCKVKFRLNSTKCQRVKRADFNMSPKPSLCFSFARRKWFAAESGGNDLCSPLSPSNILDLHFYLHRAFPLVRGEVVGENWQVGKGLRSPAMDSFSISLNYATVKNRRRATCSKCEGKCNKHLKILFVKVLFSFQSLVHEIFVILQGPL